MNNKPGGIIGEIVAALRDPLTDWLLSALLGVFMAFIVGVLRWTYDGVEFRYAHGFFSLMGVWLLCFWAMSLARKLLTPRG